MNRETSTATTYASYGVGLLLLTTKKLQKELRSLFACLFSPFLSPAIRKHIKA